MTENAAKFQNALTRAYTELFVRDSEYSAVARKMTPEDLSAKMVATFPNVRIDGEGFKSACKECGVKNSYRAVALFLAS